MANSAGLPMWQQIVVLLLTPPCVACIWWLMSRGWASSVQGGHVSSQTRSRQKFEFWLLILVLYLGLAFLFVYAHLFHGFRAKSLSEMNPVESPRTRQLLLG